MSRIHPDHDMLLKEDAVLTVWKRSSMSFQGTDGFTVFDHHGRLAFRVDNYSRKSCCITGGGGLVLMDGAGKALLTLKPQVWIYILNNSQQATTQTSSCKYSISVCESIYIYIYIYIYVCVSVYVHPIYIVKLCICNDIYI
jgi:hypothetical protein